MKAENTRNNGTFSPKTEFREFEKRKPTDFEDVNFMGYFLGSSFKQLNCGSSRNGDMRCSWESCSMVTDESRKLLNFFGVGRIVGEIFHLIGIF